MNKYIILTNYYGDMGGGEFALLQHARHLINQGKNVAVCMMGQGALRDRLKAIGVSVYQVPKPFRFGPKGIILSATYIVPRIISIHRKRPAKYILCYTLPELPFFMVAGKLCGIPVLYRDQGMVPSDGEELDWREKEVPKWIRRWLAGVICTTRAKAIDLVRRGAPQNKVKTVYLGVDTKRFLEAPSARSKILAELTIPEHAFIIGLFGRLIEWKGQKNAILALTHMDNDAHLLLVGGAQLNEKRGAEYRHELERLADEKGLRDRVHFLGFRDDVPALMKACDVICHTSYREPFGLVIIEGMMAGKPVIASDVSGPREIIRNEVNGFLVPPGDVKALANRLNLLKNAAEVRQSFSMRAMRDAISYFSSENNLLTLDVTIENCLFATVNG